MASSAWSSRFLAFSCAFHSRFPKTSWLRTLTSKSNRNDSNSKATASSLLKNLRRQSFAGDSAKEERNAEFGEQDCSESEPNDHLLSGIVPRVIKNRRESSKPTGERRKDSENLLKPRSNKGLRDDSESTFKNSEGESHPSGERVVSRPKWLGAEYFEETGVPRESKRIIRENRVLRELQREKSDEKLSTVIPSALLDSLRNSDEEYRQDEAKSILEKSIKTARSRKRKTVKETLVTSDNLHELTSVAKKPEGKWIERSLEDLEKTVDRVAPAQKKEDPELNKKIKDILSELKVAPKQLATAKTIVAAVENWGKSAFRLSQHIRDEYKEQTNEIAFDPSEFSLKDGNRLGIFDSVIDEVKSNNVKVYQSNDIFLLESDHLHILDNVDQIGVWQNSFRDDINLSNKLWQYPIDNEVCKLEEHGVSFEEHVFLEYLLDDFPKTGPVRRFMELVINGLQQNPHLTVVQKKERVHWFKDYFANFSEEELNF